MFDTTTSSGANKELLIPSPVESKLKPTKPAMFIPLPHTNAPSKRQSFTWTSCELQYVLPIKPPNVASPFTVLVISTDERQRDMVAPLVVSLGRTSPINPEAN